MAFRVEIRVKYHKDATMVDVREILGVFDVIDKMC